MGYRTALAEILKWLDIKLTPAQVPIMETESRFPLIAGGNRSGKSFINALSLVVKLLTKKVGKLYWLIGNDYEGCEGEWGHLVEMLGKVGLIKDVSKRIDPGRILLDGDTEIWTKSARYPQKIATLPVDGILLCEAAQLDYDVFLRARIRVAETHGWVSMGGTFEEEDYAGWYRELYKLGKSHNNLGLVSFSLPTWSNTVKFPGGRTDPEILLQEQGMTPERFNERFGGVPSPKSGRVIKEFSNVAHVGDYNYDPELPVEIAVDPGYAGAYAIEAIQKWGEQIVVVDELYVQGVVTKDVILILKRDKPWFQHVTNGAIDISARQHQAMEAPIEIWLKETGIFLQSCKVSLEDGIDLLRTQMKVHPISGGADVSVTH